MKTLHLNKILFIVLAVAANNLLGQSDIKIANVRLVPAGETLIIPAGTVVEFGSGAVLQVEGSLIELLEQFQKRLQAILFLKLMHLYL